MNTINYNNLPFGEGTWNHITRASSSRSIANGATSCSVELHLGTELTRAQHDTVAKYIAEPKNPSNWEETARFIAAVKCKDHPKALPLLAKAVSTGTLNYWEFILEGDRNFDNAKYHLDIRTEAPISATELLLVRQYLDGREGEGKNVLRRIFVEGRRDLVAADILDLAQN